MGDRFRHAPVIPLDGNVCSKAFPSQPANRPSARMSHRTPPLTIISVGAQHVAKPFQKAHLRRPGAHRESPVTAARIEKTNDELSFSALPLWRGAATTFFAGGV